MDCLFQSPRRLVGRREGTGRLRLGLLRPESRPVLQGGGSGLNPLLIWLQRARFSPALPSPLAGPQAWHNSGGHPARGLDPQTLGTHFQSISGHVGTRS